MDNFWEEILPVNLKLNDAFFRPVSWESLSFQISGCIFFSSNLTFSDHVNFILIKADKAAFKFWRFVNRFHSLKTSLLLNLFNVLVVTILLYCAQVWFPFISQKDKNKIESFLTQNLKRILGAPISSANAAVYQNLNTLSIDTIVKTNILKFVTRLKEHWQN